MYHAGMKLAWALLVLMLALAAAALAYPRLAAAPLSLRMLPEARKEASVAFVGDLMFDRFVRGKAEEYGSMHTLEGVAELLLAADFAAGNLEGPVTGSASVSRGTAVGDLSNMRFTFPTTTPALLRAHNFRLVSIGNNHMLDFGREGAEETKRRLTDAGIAFVGDPLREAPDIVVKEAGGLRLAFVGYNEFFGQTVEDVQEAIRAAREHHAPDFVVVLAHWGEEYLPDAPDRVKEAARSFVDAGVDLVIGSHPHVIQPSEDYHGGRIYYSLGNFVFDQYWKPEVRCGLAVIARFTADGVEYEETRIGMERDGRTVVGCR